MKKLLLSLLLPISGVSFAQNCLEYSPIAEEYVVSSLNRELAAQVITMTSSMTNFEVSLDLSTCKQNGLGGAQLDIVGLKDGKPDLNSVLGSATAPESDIIGWPNCSQKVFKAVVFKYNGVKLQSGSKYALVLKVSEGSNQGCGLMWKRSSTPTDPSNPYTGGNIWTIRNFRPDRMDYRENTNLDLQFKICETKKDKNQTSVNDGECFSGKDKKLLFSENGNYSLMLQTDGHVVVRDSNGNFKWGSSSWGVPLGKNINKVCMNNGNLIFSSGNTEIWSSKSSGTGAKFIITNEGKPQIIGTNGTVIYPK